MEETTIKSIGIVIVAVATLAIIVIVGLSYWSIHRQQQRQLKR